MSEEFEAATTQAIKLRAQSWNDWCDQALKGSAKMMHKITRLQQVWNPSVVERAPGIFSSCPDDVLAAEAEALRAQWLATGNPPAAEVPDRECFPRATVEEIRSASRKFCQFTSSTLDGFHPRHICLLGDAGISTLSVLFEAVERLGLFP
eukprot:8934145-Pyramimonas_sp.AAC.1